MQAVSDYKKVIIKVKGKWRYVYKPVYIDKGKGQAREESKDPRMLRVNGETLRI